jgi:hypothetical protein
VIQAITISTTLRERNIGCRGAQQVAGSPWENGYIESFNGKFRDEFLNRELLDTLLEARVLTARWRRHYNTERPHSALGYRPPAPEALLPAPRGGEERLQRQQLQALKVGG